MLCTEATCDDWPPECDSGYYRPTEGEEDEYGLVACALCENTDCEDFVIPDC